MSTADRIARAKGEAAFLEFEERMKPYLRALSSACYEALIKQYPELRMPDQDAR